MVMFSSRSARSLLGAAALSAAALLVPVTAQAAGPIYKPHPVRSGGVQFTPSAVAFNPFSPDGRLVAGSSTTGGVGQAAVYNVKTKKVTLLGSVLGGSGSAAIDVNDKGDVVGSVSRDGQSSVFYHRHGRSGFRDLGTLGGRALYPYAINNSGTIVGGWLGETNEQAFRWRRSVRQLELLSNLPGDTESRATGINSAGTIVGESGLTGVVWKTAKASPTPIPNASGGRTAYPRDLNDSGIVVGVADGPGDDDNEAFRYSLATKKLKILTGGEAYAKAISARGAIVGNVGSGQGAVWNDCRGGFARLGDPTTRVVVYGIDAKGAIWTSYDNDTRTVRWTRTRGC